MADVYSIKKSTLDAIGNAVREKDGTSADIPVIELEARIKAITTGVDTSADTVVADALTEGYTAHDAAGNLVNGANPYEKATTNTTVNTQAELIAQIQTALEGKAAGGATVKTCSFLLTPTAASSTSFFSVERFVDGEITTQNLTGTMFQGEIVCGSTILVELPTYHGIDYSGVSLVREFPGSGATTMYVFKAPKEPTENVYVDSYAP